jgi:hypothetical protein
MTLEWGQTDEWIAELENPQLNNEGTNNQFYDDGHLNIGFGFNLNAQGYVASRADLAVVGIIFTDDEWLTVQEYVLDPGGFPDFGVLTGIAALNASLAYDNGGTVITISISEALKITDNYLTNTVVPGLENNIPDFMGGLKPLTQEALEDMYYNGPGLLGPITYSDANSANLYGLAEQISFNANNSPVSCSGLELRYLADGLLALNVKPVISAANKVTSIDTSQAQTSDIQQFLTDTLVGNNTLGSGGVSAYAYVHEWGAAAVSDFTNIAFLLDQYLVIQDTYVATPAVNSFPGIDSEDLTVTGDDTRFDLINATNYQGTIGNFVNAAGYQGNNQNFVAGDTLDLIGVPVKDVSVGYADGLRGPYNINIAHGGSFILAPLASGTVNWNNMSYESDGNGGTILYLVYVN